MSKRPPTNNNAANAPAAKKSRIDIDDTVTEVKTQGIQLLDSLKAQKAAVQWGHTTCRDDTMASIKKAESLISSHEKLDASNAVENLIDALIESEVRAMITALEKYSEIWEEAYEQPEASILEGVQKWQHDITRDVKKQLKQTLKDLTVDETIEKVQAETKSAYKAAAKKKFVGILENALN
ncbi:hypothetical protein M436DRAFT_82113 [Aureobasidium namibiae CBS 147.97]|uniref:Uncharacterized protein n=1 Tax=Aureobasidium namibiae CBS 147.97 TaxID=1043004 RepID=A0A074WMK4_9PEZI